MTVNEENMRRLLECIADLLPHAMREQETLEDIEAGSGFEEGDEEKLQACQDAIDDAWGLLGEANYEGGVS
jgi:hypothetical protein